MNEIELGKTLEANLHSEVPSDELLRSLRAAALRTPGRTLWWQSRILYAGGAVAGLITAGLLLLPGKASAKSFDDLLKAADEIHRFEFTIQSKDAKMTLAAQDGHFAIRPGNGVVIQVDGDSLRFYSPSQNTVARFKLAGFINAEELARQADREIARALKNLNLKKLLLDYQKQFGKDRVEVSSVANENGHRRYHVRFEKSGESEKVELTVNGDSDLPERIEVMALDKGIWSQTSEVQMRFGSQVDENSLKVEVPPDAKHVDIGINDLIADGGKALQNVAPILKQIDPEIAERVRSLIRIR